MYCHKIKTSNWYDNHSIRQNNAMKEYTQGFERRYDDVDVDFIIMSLI